MLLGDLTARRLTKRLKSVSGRHPFLWSQVQCSERTGFLPLTPCPRNVVVRTMASTAVAGCKWLIVIGLLAGRQGFEPR
jgi:hypothetical protein